MKEPQSVDVCLTTYKRPNLLQKSLVSLGNQNADGIRIRIIVVDNDYTESARACTEAFQKTSSIEVIYDVEPVQNISLARNKALHNVKAELFAFIDDDEVVVKNWLTSLVDTLIKYKADAVFGPVIRKLPRSSPQWTREHPFFKGSRWETGTKLTYGGTGNVLVRKEAIGKPSQRFDPLFGHNGSEDTDFFYRLYLLGKNLVWCDEALAYEHVTNERKTFSWLCQRSFRGGQGWMLVIVKRYSLLQKTIWLTKKTFQLIIGVMLIPVLRILSYTTYAKIIFFSCSVAGQLTTFFKNYKFLKEYENNKY